MLRHWGRRLGTIGALGALLNLHPISLPGQSPRREVRQVHLGMEVRLVTFAPTTAATDSSIDAAFAEIARLEQILSDWRPSSELSELPARATGRWALVSPELFDVLGKALAVAAASDGAFDPTIGPLTRLWRVERTSQVPSPDSAWRRARAAVNWRAVQLDSARQMVRLALPGMRLDLGGIAKGWILARARDVLVARGLRTVMLEAGGDVVVGTAPLGTSGWLIGVQDDDDERILSLSNTAVATSGPSMQAIRDADGSMRSHVIDPRTGRGLEHRVEVTVRGDDPALTDAVATALTVLPRDAWPALLERFGVTLLGARRAH